MRVSEAIGEVLARERVAHVFGLMGHGNIKVIPHLAGELGIPFVAARHEANAMLMADAYARVTGRVGVCTVTQGPGLTNTLTALVTARKARTPMIVLAGDSVRVDGNLQWIDQEPIFAAAGVPVQVIDGPETLGDALTGAFRRARSERTPIGVNLPPLGQQDAECVLGPAVGEADTIAAPLVPPTRAIVRAIDILERCRRPVILAGRGAVWADARAELEALADTIGALLATTLLAKSFFDGNPYSVGIAGGFASRLTLELLADADGAVVFGAGLNPFTTEGGELFAPDAPVVHCDVDADAIGAMLPVAHGLHGDAAVSARLLRQECERRGFHQPGYRGAAVRQRLASWRAEEEFEDESAEGALDPRTLTIALDSVLPRERTLVAAGGHCQGWPCMYLSVPHPSNFVHPLNFGSVGCGLGAALGAAVARPDLPTVAVLGDGDLMMGLADLDTAVRHRLRLILVVLNDGGFGSEIHSLREWGLRENEARYDNPDFVALARAVGGDGIVVRSLADLAEVGQRAAALDGLLVLDCRITTAVRADWDANLQLRTGAASR